MLDTLTWTPAAVFLAVVVTLTTPFLGFIALLALLLAALAALAGAVIAAAFELGRSILRRLHGLPPPHRAPMVIRDAVGRAR
jgi:hypothetical protein